MPTAGLRNVLGRLRTAASLQEAPALTDGELLERYVAGGDAVAFEALVRRHRPMVLAVCRRLLTDPCDAEDAFQATFLVLVRKAPSVVPREKVANWLYGVACHAAQKARTATARRRSHERQVRTLPEPATVADGLWHDLAPLLDQELSRLPEKYRVPLVLCDLEGRTRTEVARHLAWPEGTVAGRLARGRALLARRLARHGLPLSGGVLAALLAQNAASACVPVALVQSTVKAASLLAAGSVATAGMISAKVAGLAEGVVKAMFLSKLKTAMVVVLLVSAIAALGYGGLVAGQPDGKAEGTEDPAATAEERPQGSGGPGNDNPPVVRQKVDPRIQKRIEEPQKALPEPEAAATGAARSAELMLGQKVEGEIDGKSNVGGGGEGHLHGHSLAVPITLKAGSNVSASVTVVGRLRTVGLMLKDPTGKILGSSKMEPRTARISVEEVNANGRYTIEVYSDLIGPYTLWATDTTDELDRKMLGEKINHLEKELAELRKKLKAMENKKPQ
jgi:RNA polymerase sigma factor (sigma-70 family)